MPPRESEHTASYYPLKRFKREKGARDRFREGKQRLVRTYLMLLPRVLLRPTASPALLPLLLSMVPATGPAVGTLHTGTVKRIEAYGAFCSLEGVPRDGLLHISQMDPDGKRVHSVASVVSIGDRLRVRVKSLEDGKIGLTVAGVKTQPAGSRMRAQYEQSAAGVDAPGPPPTAEELERLPCLSLSFTRSSGSGVQHAHKLGGRAPTLARALTLSLTLTLFRRAERQQAEHAVRGEVAARRLPLAPGCTRADAAARLGRRRGAASPCELIPAPSSGPDPSPAPMPLALALTPTR